MNNIKRVSFWIVGSLTLATVSAAAPSDFAPVAAARTLEASETQRGVVVDPNRGVVYAMNVSRGLNAVAMQTGELLWSSQEAAVPLAVEGEALIAQGQPADRSGVVEILSLDLRTGEVGKRLTLALPENVWGTVDESMGKSLALRAAIRQGQPFVSWRYTERYVKGIAPAPEEDLVRHQDGAYLVDFQAGTARVANPASLDVEPALPVAVQRRSDSGELSLKPMIAGGVFAATRVSDKRIMLERWTPNGVPLVEVELFRGQPLLEQRSADGGHLAVVERVAPGEWEEYGWSIFSLESGEKLDQVRSHQSSGWFVIHGSTLIDVARSVTRRVGDELVTEPLRLRSIDLADSSLNWQRPIRDTTYRGLLPP